MARGVASAASLLNRTGVLAALTPRGVLAFARAASGVKSGPHVGLMLHAKTKPEKIALVDGGRRYAYGELDAEINRLAHGLAGLGVEGGSRVGLMMPNSAEYIVAQQALARIGATAVQIGYRLKAQEIGYILENAEPIVVIHHEQFTTDMSAARAELGPDDAHVIVTGVAADQKPPVGMRFEDLQTGHPGAKPPPATGKGGGGIIIYTSGTTGRPKGASREYSKTKYDAVLDFLGQVGWNHDDVQLVVCPLYHSAAPVFAALMFTLGGTVVIGDHFDAEGVLALIERERITCAFMVPTQLVRLCSLPAETLARYDTSSLRWVLSGAAPLATETARRFQDTFGRVLWNFYGSTETGLVTLAGPGDHVARPGTVGRPLAGNAIRLLDQNGATVEAGEVGELWVRNSMLIGGYHKNEGATEGAMRDGFFFVGDMARMDADGYVYLESRKHDMVISGGVNIYPREIEDLLHTHPDILEAAVVGVPDEEWGESLAAFIVRRPGTSLTEAAVGAFCKESLANYKRPRYVEFMEELPHNPTGKVLKRELRKRALPTNR